MKKFFLFLFLVGCVSSKENTIVKMNSYKLDNGESIKLFIGDQILVEADVVDNSLKNFRIVKSIVDSSKTISFDFFNDSGNPKSPILSVENPFDLELHYKAKIKPAYQNKYFPTSIIPVRPKLISFELWSNEIESIILYDFELKKGK